MGKALRQTLHLPTAPPKFQEPPPELWRSKNRPLTNNEATLAQDTFKAIRVRFTFLDGINITHSFNMENALDRRDWLADSTRANIGSIEFIQTVQA